eukprot:3631989-Amphidinium_carterae.2
MARVAGHRAVMSSFVGEDRINSESSPNLETGPLMTSKRAKPVTHSFVNVSSYPMVTAYCADVGACVWVSAGKPSHRLAIACPFAGRQEHMPATWHRAGLPTKLPACKTSHTQKRDRFPIYLQRC